jgi:hypothetical protein
MSKRHFSALLVITVIAALAVSLLVPQRMARESGNGMGLLLPEVGERINAVTQVVLQGAAMGTVQLDRIEDRWQVRELNGYPADWARLRQLLADLAQARILETKTDNPEYYARLGVEDPAQAGATGAMLTLRIEDQEWALIIGNEAAGRAGQYVRLAHSAPGLLIDRVLDIPFEPVGWAERSVVDIPSGDVAEVEVIHPDGDWILARKPGASATDFELENLPAGRETASGWSVNSLGGALSALRMDGVEQGTGDAVDQGVRFRLLTFSGIEYTAAAWQDDAQSHWIMLKAAAPALPAEAEADADVEAATDARLQEVEAFNRRVSGWRFKIPEYKYTAMTKRLEQLLKPIEDSAAASD